MVKQSLLPAVLYLRMSSDQQGGSIEQQRNEVRKWAKKNGYKIIREYIDSGKSGSTEQEKRTGFQRLLLDSQQGEFVAVLCWDTSRFGRLDPIKAALAKDVLREAGVHLATVKEGKIDWNSFEGLVADFLYSLTDHKYSRDLSANSIRGRLALLERGYWPSGCVPFGYDKEYVEPSGITHHIPRRQTFSKPRGWERKLVINDDEALIVRRIFFEWLKKDKSMRQIARELNEDGILRPDNDPSRFWTKDTVREMLHRKVYAGYVYVGGVHKKLRKQDVINRFGKHECKGIHDPIITLKEWKASVAKLDDVRNKVSQIPYGPRSSALSGILICGHCGYRMDKRSREDANGDRYAYFTCSSSTKRTGCGCKQWRALESEMLPFVIERLCDEMDRQVLATMRHKSKSKNPNDKFDRLNKKLNSLKAKIKQGQERYLSAPDELLKGCQATLQEWCGEASSLEDQISKLTVKEGAVSSFLEQWEKQKGMLKIASGLWEPNGNKGPMGNGLFTTTDPDLDRANLDRMKSSAEDFGLGGFVGGEKMTDPAIYSTAEQIRAFLKSINFKVTLYWKERQSASGKRTFYDLDRGRMEAEYDLELFGGSYQ